MPVYEKEVRTHRVLTTYDGQHLYSRQFWRATTAMAERVSGLRLLMDSKNRLGEERIIVNVKKNPDSEMSFR